jgi:phosphoserine aminotransferase
VARLESYTPAWPLPKLFRMTKGGKLIDGLFAGETINTPSMLAVEDALDSLDWAQSVGGLAGLVARVERNAAAIDRWVEVTSWVDYLAARPEIRSTTSVCLTIVDSWFRGLEAKARAETAKRLAALVEAEGAGYDLAAYRDAPPGLRIWAGATVDTADLEALFPWLDWAYAEIRAAAAA